MNGTTPPEDNSSNISLSAGKEGTQERQQEVTLEILEGAFDRDKSPLIEGVSESISEQINTNDKNQTTVERPDATTLYGEDGRVLTTLPTECFRGRERMGENFATVVGDKLYATPDTLDFDIISGWRSHGDAIRFRNNSISEDVATCILQYMRGNYWGNIDWDDDSGRVNVGVTTREWPEFKNKMIQQGKLIVVDPAKAQAFSSVQKPNPESLAPEIQSQMDGWVGHFPQKKSLFINGEKDLSLLDWGDDVAANWSVTKLDMPEEIKNVTGAGLDPRENFLLVGSENTLYVLDMHTKPMKIVQKITSPGAKFEGAIRLRDDGSILAGDKEGHFTCVLSNLHIFQSHREKTEQARALQKLKNRKRVAAQAKTNGQGPDASEPLSAEIQEMARDLTNQFTDDIANADSLDKISQLRAEVKALKQSYSQDVKDTKLIDAMFKPVFDSLEAKESEILRAEIEERVKVVRGLLNRIEHMSLPDLADARKEVDRIRTISSGAGIDPAIRAEVARISDSFTERATEVLERDEEGLLKQLDDLMAQISEKLSRITRFSEFEIWQDVDYPAFLDALATQMRIIPASHKKIIEKLREVEKKVRDMKREYASKFKEQYDKVREEAATRTDAVTQLALERVGEFLESFSGEVKKKSFRNTDQAKQWVEKSPLYSSTLAVIDDLGTQDPEKADDLRRKLKVEIAQLVYQVKTLKSATIDESTGRQMVTFGKVSFPIWESRAEKVKEPKVELIYKVDNSSKGPGVKPDDYMCELFYRVTDDDGKIHEIPMYSEDARKYGMYNERFYDQGSYLGSYIRLGDARKVLSAVKERDKKGVNEIKRKYEEFQKKIEELNKRIAKRKASNKGDWSDLKEERSALTKEYVMFLQESGLYGWFALRSFKRNYQNGGNAESIAGQGRVPDWASYWVVDEEMEKSLEQFASMAKMSLGNREGLISLEGHAGTGKDVLVQMFANRTKRPLYSFDCTKWTTEFDLSQDVSLAAEDGASFTVKEDSVIVKALETPGSILYFNEFNAMPEFAQIFLHSLFDAKRQVTLKTSSGRVVKADPTVIICSSMNPGYPGTNHPQFATRSRMIPIKLLFPEFKRADNTYGSSEALRVARSVRSLEDLTLDPDMSENEFVKLWDNYINKGISNGAMTPERKFDLEVIFALITFAGKIREGFINKISKKGGRNTFSISQPFTLRDMRRCAYMLSHMDPSEKQNPDTAEAKAKDLIRQFYSQYIFDEKEEQDLETNLAQWTVEKPVHATI